MKRYAAALAVALLSGCGGATATDSLQPAVTVVPATVAPSMVPSPSPSPSPVVVAVAPQVVQPVPSPSPELNHHDLSEVALEESGAGATETQAFFVEDFWHADVEWVCADGWGPPSPNTGSWQMTGTFYLQVLNEDCTWSITVVDPANL